MFGGGVSFVGSETLNTRQEEAFAKAFINSQPAPELEFDVDNALEGNRRNAWLPKLHISVNSDYSSFADEIRESRERLHTAMLPLFERWQAEKPTFEAVLKEEMAAYGKARIEASERAWKEYFSAMKRQDWNKVADISLSSHMGHMMTMVRAFERYGVSKEDCLRKLFEFWRWKELQKMPFLTIKAHLFAAIAARLASGQKKKPSRGLSNDIKSISTFAPYVDAMFIDIECENLLNDGRLRKALTYKARVFSKATSKEFFSYLESLEDTLDSDVKRWASFLYGLRPPSSG